LTAAVLNVAEKREHKKKQRKEVEQKNKQNSMNLQRSGFVQKKTFIS
jgi:hypothetical protein